MTTEQLIAVAAAIAVGLLALVGALLTFRALARAGTGLRALEAKLEAQSTAVEQALTRVPAGLRDAHAQTERALWTLTTLDERLDGASAAIRARRDASDRLRSRLIDGQANVARLRETIRLLIRLNDLRREFWA